MPLIEFDGVSKVYRAGPTEVHALSDVTLRIDKGEVVAVTGPSGSGKSTLLNLVGALDRPTRGRVLVDGLDLSSLDDAALTRYRRLRVGFIFQFFNLLPTMTAVENVMLPALLAGHARKEATERAMSLLERVSLAPRAHHRPDELSGGEMQRVAIARALVMEPPLVLADEPTGNLDSAMGADVMRLLRQEVASPHRIVVLVTHDPKVAAAGTRSLFIQDGAVSEGVVAPAAARDSHAGTAAAR